MRVRYVGSVRKRVCLATAAVVSLLAAAVTVPATEFRNPQFGYFVDVPEGWQVMQAEEASQVAFTDQQSRAVLQIFAFEPDRFDSAEGIASFVRERFSAQGESSAFTYQGGEASFADMRFATGRRDVRGYLLFLNGGGGQFSADFAVMSYTDAALFQDYQAELISTLNSFAPDPRSRRAPGPVSQFYFSFPPPSREDRSVALPGDLGRVAFPVHPEEAEVSQIFIEREAELLQQYAQAAHARWGRPDQSFHNAWKRYYKAIYRDNSARLKPLARQLEARFAERDTPRAEIPAILLRWLQGFEYVRVPSLSDLNSPVRAVLQSEGDCDSLALVYTILLHHLDFDAILLVSNRYSHALAGVDVEGEGARFEFEGTRYLLAELTEDVEIGLIPREMADPSGWLAVPLR